MSNDKKPTQQADLLIDAPSFLDAALPILVVFNPSTQITPEIVQRLVRGFPEEVLPLFSRAIKNNLGLPQDAVTVIVGSPSDDSHLSQMKIALALRARTIPVATQEEGAILAAQFVVRHYDPELVIEAIQHILKEGKKGVRQ